MFCVVMEGRKEEGKGREECDDWTMTLSVKDPGPEAERLEAPALGPPRTNMHKYTSLEATVNGSPIVEPVRPVRGHHSSSPRSLALSDVFYNGCSLFRRYWHCQPPQPGETTRGPLDMRNGNAKDAGVCPL